MTHRWLLFVAMGLVGMGMPQGAGAHPGDHHKAPRRAKPSTRSAPTLPERLPTSRPVPRRKTLSKTTPPTTQPSTRPVRSDEELTVIAFWQAVLAHDHQTLFGLVGFPFVSDAKCNVLKDFKALEGFLNKQTLPKKVTIGEPVTLSPKDKLPPDLRKSIGILAPLRANCSDETTNKLIGEASTYPVQFVWLALKVGDKELSTVVRLSRIKGRWLVTGLHN